jgi:hypothetical protein
MPITRPSTGQTRRRVSFVGEQNHNVNVLPRGTYLF